MSNKKIETPFGDASISVTSYQNNNRLAVILNYGNDEMDVLTINLPDYVVQSFDCAFIDGDINNEFNGVNIIDTLKDKGIIEESYGFYNYNLGKYECVKFNLEKLKEYDPNGVKEYLDKYEIKEGLDIDEMEIKI